MQTRANYIESLRETENQNAVNNLFADAGWVGDYTVDELNLIDRSINDLPHPNIEYQEPDGYDWVDNNGNLIIYASKIPFRDSSCV